MKLAYAEVRPKIRSGDLLAWTHRSFRSYYDLEVQAVRMATRSEYCHVGIAWVIGGRVFALEAVQPRSRPYPLSLLGDFYHLPLKAKWNKAVESRALGLMGIPYSKWQAIEAFLKKNIPEGEDRMQCAKLSILIARELGIDLGSVATPSAVVQAALDLGAPLFHVKGEK